MRFLMYIAQSGYPPDNMKSAGMKILMHVDSAGCQSVNDGDISPFRVVWFKDNVSNISIHQCLLA